MQQCLVLLLLAIVGIGFSEVFPVQADTIPPPSSLMGGGGEIHRSFSGKDFPPLQVHTLPPSLANFRSSQTDDYFDQVIPSPLGHLIWSEFPIKVYLDQSPSPQDSSASNQRFLQWTQAVRQAIADWSLYLPMQEVGDKTEADIRFERQEAPLNAQRDPQTGQLQISRARNAQTYYEFYSRASVPSLLLHRMTVRIKPGLSPAATLATARHELGHALGIWGHSPNPKDTLYFSQTDESPPISIRDINTLKKVYLQPTRLGWPFP
jgi:predicted Zn-dependent protease